MNGVIQMNEGSRFYLISDYIFDVIFQMSRAGYSIQ